jgi:uncharacterized cupin superfamily protein
VINFGESDATVTLDGAPNLFNPTWDERRDEPPFTWQRARVGRQAGSSKLGASVFEVPAGSATFPLHVHWVNEELIVVLQGRLTLQSADAESDLGPGDIVACPAGPQGGHRLDNRGDEPARVLVVSTMISTEMNTYPGTDRFWARTYAPGEDAPVGALDVRGSLDELH